MGNHCSGLAGWLADLAGLVHRPNMGWQVLLLAWASVTLVLTDRCASPAPCRLELTRDELPRHEGRVLARLDRLQAVLAGFFAFKPSNVFRFWSTARRERQLVFPGLGGGRGPPYRCGRCQRQPDKSWPKMIQSCCPSGL